MRLPVLILIAFILAACGGGPGKTYSFTPPTTTGGRMCVNQCRMSVDYCKESCDINYRKCVHKVQVQALKDYDKYTREEYASGGHPDLTLQDFERMTPCNETHDSCYNGCETGNKTCYETCGGKVEVKPSCGGFFCAK
ncbi:MAG: hypothetical protein AB7H77_04230 [Bdellovibrionales bacterium]